MLQNKQAKPGHYGKLLGYTEIKSLDETTGEFLGYASVFNVCDSYRDVICPGAFQTTLKETNREIKLLWQHQANEPIGKVLGLREDGVGLLLHGKLLLTLRRGMEAYELIKQRVISGLSIGYNVRRSFEDGKKHQRIITDIDLWEISLVTFPANKYANIIQLKSQQKHL